MMIQKTAPKKLSDANIAKYYLLTLILLIKTKGKRQTTGPKPGREKCHAANDYLYYLQSFLKGYDVKFRFEGVFVLKETMSRLPVKASKRSK